MIRRMFIADDDSAGHGEDRGISQQTKIRLGTYRGRRYYLTTRVTPGFNSVEEFSVVVYYRHSRIGDSVQIARIDTSHGFVHFDRLNRRDQPKEPIDVDVWEAAELLETNWRRYARSYDQVHRE